MLQVGRRHTTRPFIELRYHLILLALCCCTLPSNSTCILSSQILLMTTTSASLAVSRCQKHLTLLHLVYLGWTLNFIPKSSSYLFSLVRWWGEHLCQFCLDRFTIWALLTGHFGRTWFTISFGTGLVSPIVKYDSLSSSLSGWEWAFLQLSLPKITLD